MADRDPRGRLPDDGQQRYLRRSWWSLVASFAALAVLMAVRLVTGSVQPIDLVLAGLVATVGVAAVSHRRAIAGLEEGRRLEADSFARILQGLSRSVSPDAIVDAIVEDLGVATGADHTVVVRLRADARILEATLVSSRAGVPSSTTMLPLSDLEDPGEGQRAQRGRRPVAVPIHTDVVAVPMGDRVATEAGGSGSGGSGSAGRRSPRVRPAGPGTEPPFEEWEPAGLATLGHAGAAGGSGRERAVAQGRTAAEGRTAAGETAAAEGRAAAGVIAAASAQGLAEGSGLAEGLTLAEKSGSVERSRSVGAPGEIAPGSAMPVDAVAGGRIAVRLAARVAAVYGLKNTLAAPLVTRQGVVGAIVLSHRTSDPWPASTARFVRGAAVEAAAALERAYSYREAEARASTDALTGLPNRRYFDEFCGLLARRRRSDDAVGVLMVDIDHFKRLNDKHGHPVGDQVLRAVASAIANAVREGDVPARFGGEEFAVLLRNPGPGIAAEVGERVRAGVEALDLAVFGPPGVTVSVGVAVATSHDQPISELVDQADHALYRAKRLGRNRVVSA